MQIGFVGVIMESTDAMGMDLNSYYSSIRSAFIGVKMQGTMIEDLYVCTLKGTTSSVHHCAVGHIHKEALALLQKETTTCPQKLSLLGIATKSIAIRLNILTQPYCLSPKQMVQY